MAGLRPPPRVVPDSILVNAKGARYHGLELRVKGLGCRVQGSGSRV